MPRSGARRRRAGPEPVVIRESTDADVAAIEAIYAHHVLNGLASFEETPPDVGEIARRRAALVDDGFPHLVAVADGEVAGFAYASGFRPRPAYRYTVEDSVYVAPEVTGRGTGRALLAALIERCTRLGYRQMVAVIGDSANHPSIALHESLGFRRAASFRSVGFKFGRWVDVVVLQRALGEGDETLP